MNEDIFHLQRERFLSEFERAIDLRKEGTRNYYFIDSQSSSLKQLAKFWDQVEPMMKMCSQINQKRGYKK